jgi:hypothetical protein
MDRLLSPCTRLHDLLASRGRLEVLNGHHPVLLQELNLDVSTEAFLSPERAFTYTDLYAIFGSETTVLWLTPYAAIARSREIAVTCCEQLNVSYRFCFSADRIYIFVLARSHEDLLEICDVVL